MTSQDFEQAADDEARGGKKKVVISALIGLVVLALMIWGLHALIGSKSGSKTKPPKITLIQTPPPPPPPPPKFEKKIEPPKETKEIKVDQVQKVEPVAPSPELKMDGPAGDAPSAFASGNITSEDLSKIGTDKGPLGTPANFNNYSFMLKSELQYYLSKDNSLRRQTYKVEVKIWLEHDGTVKKAELITATGDDETDDEIRTALSKMPKFSLAPPANMPQPVHLRIVSSGRH